MFKHPSAIKNPTAEQLDQIETLRRQGEALAKTLSTLPANRERTLALAKLEDLLLWANKSVMQEED